MTSRASEIEALWTQYHEDKYKIDMRCTFVEYVLVEMKCNCSDKYCWNFDIEEAIKEAKKYIE